jgi:hypothetical protein
MLAVAGPSTTVSHHNMDIYHDLLFMGRIKQNVFLKHVYFLRVSEFLIQMHFSTHASLSRAESLKQV